MAAVTISGMLAAEAKAFAEGWTEERLLDLAGERLGRAVGRFFPEAGTVIGYLGKGHNAGDALVALGVLRNEFGWKIGVRSAWPAVHTAPLTREKWRALDPPVYDAPPSAGDARPPLLLLDGLLGTGSSGPLKAPLASLAEEMKDLRQHAGARVAAVDLPSGVDADTGIAYPGAVTADATFMIANAKRGLLLGSAANSTGALVLVPVEPLTHPEPGDLEVISPLTMDFGKAPRPFDFHKGQAGHVGLIVGSERYAGAAALAATGALRGGAGLVTLMIPQAVVSRVASQCPPEVILRGDASPLEWQCGDFDALVIGCGLGEPDEEMAAKLLELIGGSKTPAVIDADGLNLVAKRGGPAVFGSHQVLTPHPGEFRRLAPELAEQPRETACRDFCQRTAATLLLKGGRTLVTRAGHPLWANSTGSPGMATGGQGDLLAGVIGARLASGEPPHHAAALGAWLCGRAAEIALARGSQSEESLTPGDVSLYLGSAFLDWKRASRT